MTDIMLRTPIRCWWTGSGASPTRLWYRVPLLYLLEQGLHVYEGDGSVRLDNQEADALAAAIAALEGVPDDQGATRRSAASATHTRLNACAVMLAA